MVPGKLAEQIGELSVHEASALAQQMLAERIDPFMICDEVMEGLRIVGDKYNNGKCFIADLIVSGMLAQEIFSLINDTVSSISCEKIMGKVVIGTIYEDIHDIGKNLFCDRLRCNGVDVIDLGVDVPVGEFIAAVESHKPDILAVSTVMDNSFTHIKDLIMGLGKAGISGNIKIVVGGAAADARFVQMEGVHCLTNDCRQGIDFCLRILKEKKKSA
ncbi:MAG: cobalamin-dependent protein [Dehalobacterium sp.]